MLAKDLDAMLIIQWEIPACVIVYKKDSKILKECFSSRESALEFCSKNEITIQELIGKGWNERINGTLSGV